MLGKLRPRVLLVSLGQQEASKQTFSFRALPCPPPCGALFRAQLIFARARCPGSCAARCMACLHRHARHCMPPVHEISRCTLPLLQLTTSGSCRQLGCTSSASPTSLATRRWCVQCVRACACMRVGVCGCGCGGDGGGDGCQSALPVHAALQRLPGCPHTSWLPCLSLLSRPRHRPCCLPTVASLSLPLSRPGLCTAAAGDDMPQVGPGERDQLRERHRQRLQLQDRVGRLRLPPRNWIGCRLPAALVP